MEGPKGRHTPIARIYKGHNYPLLPQRVYLTVTEQNSSGHSDKCQWGRLPAHLPYKAKVDLLEAVASSRQALQTSYALQKDLMNLLQQVYRLGPELDQRRLDSLKLLTRSLLQQAN